MRAYGIYARLRKERRFLTSHNCIRMRRTFRLLLRATNFSRRTFSFIINRQLDINERREIYGFMREFGCPRDLIALYRLLLRYRSSLCLCAPFVYVRSSSRCGQRARFAMREASFDGRVSRPIANN